ncbi:hypothetical protein HHL21_12075 [Massilia sp. RP-1-19]|uniref:Uncharacterized protein n=1 Tax=Massilia polaris TaxID=2728846 RepID=A0A848HKP8_9BURK|nr:hypothetical protein [Massilia polaris]NML61804.1 hypothetical protein [Massilia polaris]
MSIRTDITEAMIEAAMNAGPLTHEFARRVLSAGLSKMANTERGAPFPLWVSTSIDTKRARFLGVTERRCYYRIETECGQRLTVHGNDIQPSQ